MPKRPLSSLLIAACCVACSLDTRPNIGSGGNSISQCESSGNPCDGGVSGNGGKPAETGGGVAVGASGGSGGAGATGGSGQSVITGGEGGMSSEQAGGTPPPPPPKKPDGESCGGDVDCMSTHCSNGVCCTNGDCCRTMADCPKTIVNGIQLACNDPSKCQGSGGTVACRDSRCMADGGDPNDSACTSSHQAKDCGPYKPVFCNGMVDQQEPMCPTSCKSDGDCDDNAHCDLFGACVADAPDGMVCTQDKDCASSHCSNSICCASGDCCANSTLTCLSYQSPATCTDPTQCKGTRKDAVCMNFQCQSMEVADTNVCSGTVVSTCDLYADAICSNRPIVPTCATTCMVDSQCAAGAYCDATASNRTGHCQAKLKDGAMCATPQQCENKCNKGFCCGDSDPNTFCCGVDADCAPLAKVEKCINTTSCTSRVTAATCVEHRCRTQVSMSETMCTQDLPCGPEYVATSATCPLTCSCARNTDCKAGFVCASASNGRQGSCVTDTSGGTAGAPVAGSSGGAAGAPAAGAGGSAGLVISLQL